MTNLKECSAFCDGMNGSPSSQGDEESGSTISENDLKPRRDRWQQVIDRQLMDWGADPMQLQDEDLIPPSKSIIGLACRIAILFRDENRKPPLRVVPNGEGGIVFERKEGTIFETFEIKADSSIEHVVYQNSRLTKRERLS